MQSNIIATLTSTVATPRVAIVRALQLGDVLCSVPALRALRAALPNAELTFIGLPWARTFASRFSCYLDRFREFPGFVGLPERPLHLRSLMRFLSEAQRAPFDLVVQMHGSGSFINPFVMLMGARKSAGYFLPGDLCPDPESFLPYPEGLPEIHRHLRLAEFLGAPAMGDELEFPLTAQDRHDLLRVEGTRDLIPGRYICVHPGARWPSRRWNASKFAVVADTLAREGWQIVLTGSADEADVVGEVSAQMQRPHLNLAGRTTLGALGALLRDSRLLVSADTGVSHVASALNLPSVVIVLGSDHVRWAPLDQTRHRLVMAPADCRPCEHFVCPIGHTCETALTADAILSAVADLFLHPRAQRLCPALC
jgi:ADP-heptose:LPS heptosyltransferase